MNTTTSSRTGGAAAWFAALPPAHAVLLLIAVASALRLFLAGMTGLGIDESYMVAAGRAFRLGYFDHPPASWWLATAAARLAGSESALVVRLPFIILSGVSTWLMFRIGGVIGSPRAGFWAAFTFNLAPVLSVTSGSWVLPDGPLLTALLGATLCLLHALPARDDAAANQSAQSWQAQSWQARSWQARSWQARIWQAWGWQAWGWQAWGWWAGAGLCAGLALFAKYSAALSIAGALLYLLSQKRHRHWLARPQPYLAALLALAVFSPVLWWNATHGWASFAFQGGRTGAMHIHPLAPLTVLAGQALFLAPWIWLPLMLAFAAALRGGPARWQAWLLACLAMPPILLFTLVAAISARPVLFHWAAPGYLMLFPLLGARIATRLDESSRAVRIWLAASAGFVCAGVMLVSMEVRYSLPGLTVAIPALREPVLDAVDWSALRGAVRARRAAGAPELPVAALSWFDAGKIDHALQGDATVLCLCTDARQYGLNQPPSAYVGHDLLLVTRTSREARAAEELRPLFTALEPLPPVMVRHAGKPALQLSLFIGHGLLAWPPPAPLRRLPAPPAGGRAAPG